MVTYGDVAVTYIGQHYRLLRDGAKAVKVLRQTIALDMPTRNNYQVLSFLLSLLALLVQTYKY
jgi:hypothetical protein